MPVPAMSKAVPWSTLVRTKGKPTVTLKPGDVLFIPAGTVHAARNVGNRRGAELATYIVEKGKPLLTDVGDRFPR